MKQHVRIRKTAILLSALLLAVCILLPSASAEEWPTETLNDAAGNTYKQVKKQDGGVEVWQFIGIFGSPDEALELVGITEKEEKGKVTIGNIPYTVRLKKAETGTEGTKVKMVSKLETGTLKNGDEQTGVVKKNRIRKWKRRRLPIRIRGIIPVSSIDWGYNQIYIQENRASGR